MLGDIIYVTLILILILTLTLALSLTSRRQTLVAPSEFFLIVLTLLPKLSKKPKISKKRNNEV